MEPDQTSSESQTPAGGGKTQWIVIAKWCVAIIVLIGLAFATNTAVEQWNSESRRLELAIAQIDQQLETTTISSERVKLESARQALRASTPHLGNLRWERIGLALLFYAIGMLPPALLLRSALHSLGETTSLSTVVAAQLLGHAGKYVPGKAMVIVLRVGALSQDGVKAVPATISIFLETFLMMAVGAAIGASVVIWLPIPRWIAFAAIAVALGVSIPTLPPVLVQIARRITKTEESELRSRIDWRLFAAAWGWSVLAWLSVGASFALLISAIPNANPLPEIGVLFAIATAAISLAVVAGFASLIPGGAGVRELVLTTVLGVSLGAVQGILSAILARVAYLVVEVILASLAWLWLRTQASPKEPSQVEPSQVEPS